jgi:hypothetical protein
VTCDHRGASGARRLRVSKAEDGRVAWPIARPSPPPDREDRPRVIARFHEQFREWGPSRTGEPTPARGTPAGAPAPKRSGTWADFYHGAGGKNRGAIWLAG